MATTPPLPNPRVGVAAVIARKADGKVICGQRQGSHGSGTWQLPGGHLEHGESFFTCAERETLEETGLKVRGVKVMTVTNDVFPEGKHYITIFVLCEMLNQDDVPEVLEPEKLIGEWHFLDWEELRRDAAGTQKELFLPLVHLFEEHEDVAALMK